MGNYNFQLDLDTVNTMSVINQWIEPKTDILEFGPAEGRLTKFLTEEKECRVTIVEIDAEAGEKASHYAAKSYIGEERGNIERFYWLKEGTGYDYIIFADVLEHLSIPEKVISECKSILKPKGKILISIPNITHNSIIIDLFNGKFEYSETGLLDRTHIHFFSYESFVKMLHDCKFRICDMVPIYSRVGNNEIANNYQDVPVEVAKHLRKRAEGSIYQYVFNVSCDREIEEKEKCINNLDLDEYETLEAQCFYGNEEMGYNDSRRIGKIFKENEEVIWEINLAEFGNMPKVRFDPMECNGIIWLEKCLITDDNKVWKIQVSNTNALAKCGKLYIFDDRDPWIEFEQITPKHQNKKLLIVFQILKYRREQEYFSFVCDWMKKIGIKFDKLTQ